MFGFRLRSPRKSLVSITNLNDLYTSTINEVSAALGNESLALVRKYNDRKIFVIDFDGDTMATQSKALTYEITSIITNAKPGDEVLVRLSSPGGAAHAYGYAAAQLSRLKKVNIPLTVSVDQIAASGGYLMACVADKIISSPWAIIGSIGVVAEFPNFFNLLQALGIEYKQYTAGAFKRTVSSMGPVTIEGEKKFQENLMDVYGFFCKHVAQNRPILSEKINQVATGEHWHGTDALGLNLVDELKTSEEFILERIKSVEFIKVAYQGEKKGFMDRLGSNFAHTLAQSFVEAVFNGIVKLSYSGFKGQKIL
jgi:serine protease SohB